MDHWNQCLRRSCTFSLTRSAVRAAWGCCATASVGGASDGNFTAAVGTPTLDGLGAVGGGAHAATEHVEIDQMIPRATLLAGLVTRILEGGL